MIHPFHEISSELRYNWNTNLRWQISVCSREPERHSSVFVSNLRREALRLSIDNALQVIEMRIQDDEYRFRSDSHPKERSSIEQGKISDFKDEKESQKKSQLSRFISIIHPNRPSLFATVRFPTRILSILHESYHWNSFNAMLIPIFTISSTIIPSVHDFSNLMSQTTPNDSYWKIIHFLLSRHDFFRNISVIYDLIRSLKRSFATSGSKSTRNNNIRRRSGQYQM